MSTLSPNAEKLILEFEVGGGKAYYDKYLAHPTVPGEDSGITIGVGYDLGYYSREQFTLDWRELIPQAMFADLCTCLGLKQAAARQHLPRVAGYQILWVTALKNYENAIVPAETAKTRATFGAESFDRLSPDRQGVLVSLVFNRGTAMGNRENDNDWNRRREMRAIRNAVLDDDPNSVPAYLRAMKRLWPHDRGLQRRRESEAALWEGHDDFIERGYASVR